jgi:plastocyanin
MSRLSLVAVVGAALAAAVLLVGAVRAMAGPAEATTAAAPAKARTWVVWADAPTNPPADLKASVPFLDQFLPKRLQIHVGDKVTFKSKNFHTATFLGSTPRSQMPLLMPDPTSHYSGIVDATGAPFWFNGGPPKFIYNPQAFQPVGSRVVADASVHSSGNFVFIPKHQYTFRFTKTGTYRVVCLVHPGMKGTIVVRPRAAKIPTPTQVAQAVLKQLNQSWKTARSLQSQRPSEPNTVFAGVGSATALMAFQPRRLTVPVGTTVTWVENSPTELHNIAFGPVDYVERLIKTLDQFPVAPGAPNQVNPFVVLGSEPPGPYIYTGTNHGNGFLATPGIDREPNSPPPDRFSVTFTKAGTYHYICMIHGKDMSGDIIVTG